MSRILLSRVGKIALVCIGDSDIDIIPLSESYFNYLGDLFFKFSVKRREL